MSMADELRRSMAVQADGPVDVGSLLGTSTSRGRTLRRRRRVATTLAVAALLGVGIGVPVVVWPTSVGPGRYTGPAGGDGAGPVPTVPMPPAAPGEPTVLDDPTVLGSDPTLLHLSVEAVPPGLAVRQPESPTDTAGLATSWGSLAGSEYLGLGSPILVDFFAGPMALEQKRGYTRQGALTVNGRPAESYVAPMQKMILWQPVTGVWVAARGINGTTAETLLAAASALRLDRVSSCSVRFTTAATPPKAALSRCDTNVTDRGLGGGRLIYRRADGSILDIRDQGDKPSLEIPNTEVAGRPGHWRKGTAQGVKGDILTIDNPGGRSLFVLITGSFTRAEAEAFLTGLTWR